MKSKKIIIIVAIIAVIAVAGVIVIRTQSGSSAEMIGYASKVFDSIAKRGAIIDACYEKYDSLSDTCVYFVSDGKTKLPSKGYIIWFFRTGYGDNLNYDGRVAVGVVDQSGNLALVYDDYDYEKAFNDVYDDLRSEYEYPTREQVNQIYKMSKDMCEITHPLHETVIARSQVLKRTKNKEVYHFTDAEIEKITQIK